MDAATRRFVRTRAQGRCEYCQLPQSAAPFFTFHIEHVQAQQHVADDSPENLALACPHCNLHKGPNVASVDPETREVIALFHPRNDNWSDHFELRGALMIGLTDVGRVTVNVLDMNSEEQVEIRRGLIERGEY